ncbi:CDP-alcohol phosphatidyltransferase family protein [Bdellovibrio sp. HCB337]|uniref:CDP-alcohol phosphatidyltransferase family protein n=1 Tax=Bdellovibrio sp. HCB337 TaxID=3394358 RepID=UPI0039A577B9
MISTYLLKKRFQNLLRPLSRNLLNSGVTPNHVTFGTMVISVVFAIVIGRMAKTPVVFWSVPVFLFVRMALNAIDGMMAKEGKMESALGVFLNELGDVVSDVALFFSFCAVSSVRLEPMILFAVLAMISEMAGVVAVQTGASRRYEGPMGKSDRAVLMGLIAVLIAVGISSSLVFDIILNLGSLALLITIVNRVRKGLLDSKKVNSFKEGTGL